MMDMAQRPGAGLFEPPPIGDPPWPSSARCGLPRGPPPSGLRLAAGVDRG